MRGGWRLTWAWYHSALTIRQMIERFRAAELRPSELLRRVLDQVDQLDPTLGAFVTLDREGAARQAAVADEQWAGGTAGPLCGVPLSVKDIIDVAGLPTGCGTPGDHPPAQTDAAVVRRLRQAGAVVLGKVHLHELALGITGENPRLGTPKNPRDRSRLPGGSSSGSAVSVAAGMVPLSVGTDTGGSVRVPAALCGVVGFKPGFDTLPCEGVHPLARSMDHVGLLAPTVEDIQLTMAALTGDSPRSPGAERRARIALLRPLHLEAERSVREAVERALELAGVAGVAEAEPVELDELGEAAAIYRTILLGEAVAVHQDPGSFGGDVRALLEEGASITAAELERARERRERFSAACEARLAGFDCLATPTTLVPAPPIGARVVEVDGRSLPVREALVRCTSPFSMVGLPALSLPCGRAAGLPVGLQLVGRRAGEGQLLALAARIQQLIRAAPGPRVDTAPGALNP